MVDRVAPGGTTDGVLKTGDVLLDVDGQNVADDGTIRVGDARVTFEHAIDMLQVGAPVRFVVWRDGREVALAATRPAGRALRPQPQPLRGRARATSSTPASSSCPSTSSC